MLQIKKVVELRKASIYIVTRGLQDAYKKAKNNILRGDFNAVQFRKREPKSLKRWYFRINEKYRAIGYFYNNETFLVTIIDDHQ